MKKMFKRLTAMTMAIAMLLSFGMTALANDLTEEEVNTILADHGFSAEAIEAIDIADKATMARQILAGTHTFEENTTVEYFNVNENGSLEVAPRATGLSSSQVKQTIVISKVTEYGEFSHFLVTAVYEWLVIPPRNFEDAFKAEWNTDFKYVSGSYMARTYGKTSGNWILYTYDDVFSESSVCGFGDYLSPIGQTPKWNISFELEPVVNAPEHGELILSTEYVHNLAPDGASIEINAVYLGVSFSGNYASMADINSKEY